LSNELVSFSLSLSLICWYVCVRVLYFFLPSLLSGCPVTKTSCRCYNHTHILIHGSYSANSKKKEKKKGEKKERRKKKKHSNLFNKRVVLARAQEALACKRERMGHCHHKTTAPIRSRSEGGEIHGDPYVPRIEQRALDDARREKCFYSFFFLDVVAAAASYPSAN
jgi:hypothetical protein